MTVLVNYSYSKSYKCLVIAIKSIHRANGQNRKEFLQRQKPLQAMYGIHVIYVLLVTVNFDSLLNQGRFSEVFFEGPKRYVLASCAVPCPHEREPVSTAQGDHTLQHGVRFCP